MARPDFINTVCLSSLWDFSITRCRKNFPFQSSSFLYSISTIVPQNLSITFIYRALLSWKFGCEKKVLPLFEMNSDRPDAKILKNQNRFEDDKKHLSTHDKLWMTLTVNYDKVKSQNESRYKNSPFFLFFCQGQWEIVRYFRSLPRSKYTQSVLIRNGPIRSTSEILCFFKKWLVEHWKLRNGEITWKIFKKCTSKYFSK